MLVGNKNDLKDKRVIPYQTAAKYAQDNDFGYYETSAKTGFNVKRAFTTLFDGNFISLLTFVIFLVIYRQLKEEEEKTIKMKPLPKNEPLKESQ